MPYYNYFRYYITTVLNNFLTLLNFAHHCNHKIITTTFYKPNF